MSRQVNMKGGPAKGGPATKPAPKRMEHRGIVRCFYAGPKTVPQRQDGGTATTAGHTVAQDLQFVYKAAWPKKNGDLGNTSEHIISLHDMVAGDLNEHDRNMHAAALSDFMKMLLLQTPSASNMRELMESGGDPLGRLSAAEMRARQQIYRNNGTA